MKILIRKRNIIKGLIGIEIATMERILTRG